MSCQLPVMLWQGLREEQIGGDVQCCAEILFFLPFAMFPLPPVLLLSPFCSQHLNQKERKILSTNSSFNARWRLSRSQPLESYHIPSPSGPVLSALSSPPFLNAKQWKCVMIRKDNLWYFLKVGNSGNFNSYNFKISCNSKDSFILPLLISLFIWYDIILSLTLIKDCETLCC